MFTIGHSTLDLDAFVELLTQHGIQVVFDIRRFPGSRKYPHFGAEPLREALEKAGIEYHWLEKLGGRRGKIKDAGDQNRGLRNDSFRNYADYMQTPAFAAAIDEMLALAADRPSAYLCSEGVYWRCHRRLVSDYLVARGLAVEHIFADGKLRPHLLTPGARIEGHVVTYPGERELWDEK